MSDRRRTRTPARRSTSPVQSPAIVEKAWTLEQVHALGATTDVVTAGQILGLSRNTAYRLARRGTFPLAVIRAGARYRVPTAAILAALHPTTADSPPPTPA